MQSEYHVDCVNSCAKFDCHVRQRNSTFLIYNHNNRPVEEPVVICALLKFIATMLYACLMLNITDYACCFALG